jgi:hypothetical protein
MGESWDEGASITEFGGLVVVRQSPLVHDRIKDLLGDIRRMRSDGAYASFAKVYDTEAKSREEAIRSPNETKRIQQSPRAAERNEAPAEPARAK